jgi:plasmid stabilization system protein ParE
MRAMSLQLKISSPASEDLISLLAHSERYFGSQAKQRYEKLIFKALAQLLQEPQCIGSRTLDLGFRLEHRSYHLSSAKRNTGVQHPRHLIVYCVHGNELLIKRVLHDSMDLPSHIDSDESFQ